MRTTLNLDDRLLAIARQRATAEGRSIGAVISGLALVGLELEHRAARRRPLGAFAGLIWIAEDFEMA